MGLQKFGDNFLGKFQCAEMPSEILKNVTIVDSPGVLSGEQQRIGRNYHMTEVCQWFAERSDIILLIFDAHKLDISDELKDIIENLRGHDDKIRIVLNKSDQVSGKELMRVYGALMWSLSKVFAAYCLFETSASYVFE
jgi:EH domain-containing protein 1